MITKIECPACKQSAKLVNDGIDDIAKVDLIYYFKCRYCHVKLGSTLSYHGLLCIWEKSKEEK